MTTASLPSASNAATSLVASVDWLRGLLIGSFGMSIAVLAIAWLGYALLQGRLSVRDGARIILGCFILFGAPAIAAAFMKMAYPDQSTSLVASVRAAPPPITTPAHPPTFDPYAGASVPNH